MRRKAFTLIEIMGAMVLIGIMFILTVINLKKLMLDNDMARFKKGYASIESSVSHLLSDTTIYGTRKGFLDTRKVEIKLKKNNTDEDFSTGEIIGQNEQAKFRDAFKYYLNIIKDNLDCKLYYGFSTDGCFMTDDGVVFGIPNTNFKDIGTITLKNTEGESAKFVPITMYVDFGSEKPGARKNDKIDPSRDAFIIGVTYDGNLQFIRTAENCNSKSKDIQCKLDEFINSNTVSKSGGD